MRPLTPRQMCLAALFAVLTGIGAQIRIPFPLVPLTLQVPFVLLSGLLGGPRIGIAAMSFYLLLGLLGIPVLAGAGGPQVVLAPTFGFLIGFIAAAGTCGLLVRRFPASSSLGRTALRSAAALAGVAVLYLVGLAGLYGNLNWIAGKPVTWLQTLEFGLVPFLPGDILKAFAAAFLSALAAPRLGFPSEGERRVPAVPRPGESPSPR